MNLRSVVIAVTAALSAGIVSGQDYPNKPVRIFAAAAGGDGDFNARQIAQGISAPLGQPVIVENRSNGFLAAEVVNKAPPDGYTLTVQSNSFWMVPLLRKTPYDVVRDFAPISLLVMGVNVLVVHPSLPVKSVAELIALAKAKPGELNYGSAGVTSSSHISMELFQSLAGVKLAHIPHKGTAPAVTSLISGELHLMINDAGLVAPLVKSGKLKALGITSAKPSALVPDLPTIAASGLPGFEWIGSSGIWAPAKTPPAIVKHLNDEIVRFLNTPGAKERFLNAGVEVVGNSPEQFANVIKSEIARISKVIKEAGIKVD